jgi:HprK-related kinase A
MAPAARRRPGARAARARGAVNPASTPAPTLAQVGTAAIRQALRSGGVHLDLGLATLRVRSDAPHLAEQLRSVYRHFPFQPDATWADVHVEVQRVPGLRRWWRPQVQFFCDSRVAFDPFPASAPLPLMEWSVNWHIGRRINDTLLLHAGVVERDGFALVMPAIPGSGKSTLTAALALSGWRLLSDEFGAFDLPRQCFVPALKPVALKNESIAVIRGMGAVAELGPEFPNTRKGTVAHLAPPATAVAQVHTPAQAGAVVLPRFLAGSATQLLPVAPTMVFTSLSFNAFNYAVLGAGAFDAVAGISQRCPAWQLIYSDLGDALTTLAQLWPSVVGRVRA